MMRPAMVVVFRSIDSLNVRGCATEAQVKAFTDVVVVVVVPSWLVCGKLQHVYIDESSEPAVLIALHHYCSPPNSALICRYELDSSLASFVCCAL
jgi:hypothetical protein